MCLLHKHETMLAYKIQYMNPFAKPCYLWQYRKFRSKVLSRWAKLRFFIRGLKCDEIRDSEEGIRWNGELFHLYYIRVETESIFPKVYNKGQMGLVEEEKQRKQRVDWYSLVNETYGPKCFVLRVAINRKNILKSAIPTDADQRQPNSNYWQVRLFLKRLNYFAWNLNIFRWDVWELWSLFGVKN